MEIRQADIVLCQFYFSDLKQSKERPVLVFKDNLNLKNNSKLNTKNSSLFYAHFINENIPQVQRVKKLNEVAIKQMSILLSDNNMKRLEN